MSELASPYRARPVDKQDSRDVLETVCGAAEVVRSMQRNLAIAIYTARRAGIGSGVIAHNAIMSTQAVNLWADVVEQLGPDAIALDVPLNPSWWRAILAAEKPADALAFALFGDEVDENGENVKRKKPLKVRAIRKQFGGQRKPKEPPIYKGGAAIKEWRNGRVVAFVDLNAQPPNPIPDRVRIEIKEGE